MAEGQGTLNGVITIYNPEVPVHPFCIPVYDIHTVHSLKSKCANTAGFILVLSFCICIKTETYIYCFSMQTSQLITSQNLTDFQWQYLFEWCS